MTTRYYRLKREMASSKQALGILFEYGKSMARVWLEYGWSMARVWLEYGWSMARVWLEYAKVPVSRLAVMLVLMIVGVNGVKAQTVDYSGTYYIANNDKSKYIGYDNAANFYLCPAQEFFVEDGLTTTSEPNGKPFLTTFQTTQAENALWIVEAITVNNNKYYTFKQKDGENYKYLTVNDALTGYGKKHRKRVHLEVLTPTTLTDKNYFNIEPVTTTASGINGYSISYYKTPTGTTYKYLNPAGGNQTSYFPTELNETPKTSGGIVGFFTQGTTSGDGMGSVWFFEVPKPIINIDEHFKLTFTCANTDVTIHYTIDGGDPSATGTDDIYTEEIQLTEGVHTIKAIAVMNSGNTGYASGVATYIVRILNTTSSYLIQNLECTDFYMLPGDVDKGNTTVNTSSLFRSTMEWTFSYAGSENGFLYYYIINGSTGDYLYTNTNNGAVYMKTNTVFNDAEDKTDYMFSIEQGYSDAEKNNPNGFHIVPKAKISDNTYCIYKGGWGNTTPPTLANSKADVMKGSNNARRPEQYHTRWNIITYAAPGNILSSLLVTTDTSNPTLFKIENLGTPGQYMNDASPVGTATTGSNELAWYIKEAASDSERKYYYIVNKNGKYLKFNQTIPATPSSMGDKSNVLSLLDYDSSVSDRYQFVFAKSTIDGAYYIVPKGLEEASNSQYYALFLNESHINSDKKKRAENSSKWKLVPFCYNPIFVESEGSITLNCSTTGAEIHYTNDGTEPDENSDSYSSTNWSSSNQVRIKAIGVIKEGGVVVSKSEVVTLLNKPDVTLEGGSQVYDGQQKRPEVKSVSVEGTSAPKYPDPETYNIAYANNINAGENTATVTITDLDANDRWYIWNVPTKTFTIEKKMLTVTADDKTVEYGHPAPEYTVTINGFENGEGRAVLTTIPSATCSTYTTSSAVGSTHDIVPSGGVDENYDFTYVNGTLTVAAAFVTLTANSGTETYDGTEQTVTGFTCSVDGLTFTGVSASGSGTNAGTYPVTFTGATANATKDDTNQYVVTEIVNGTLTIDPAAATVTADDKTKTYGEADPALTVTITGMVNGESTDLITYTISRASGNNAGTYAITPTGDAAQGNYTVSYVPGTFTINRAPLTITAINHSITYGEAPDNNGVTYGEDDGNGGTINDFVNSETEAVLGGMLSYSYNSAYNGQGASYTTTSPIGTYYIIPDGLTSTNYDITFVPGMLTVGQKSIGDGSIATGFTLSFGDGGAIILKDGDIQLNQGTQGGDEKDFIISDKTTSTSGRYSEETVFGKGNYTGSFAIRNANVNFQTDADQVEWSATFVAEPAGAGVADNTKGHKLPEGIRAYIITDIVGEWAIPEPLNYIPEGIPVLLISDKEAGGFEVEDASNHTPITTTGDGNQKDANMLEVVKEGMAGYVTDSGSPNYKKAHFNLKTIYLLSYNEFVHNMDGYLSDGKVFLNPNHPTDPSSVTAAPSPAPPRLRIKWDDVTGIKELQNDGNTETQDAAWYSLDGRRIDNSKFKIQNSKLPKGIYITNGRKVIIK